jgi:hypothetical protein
MTTKTELQQEIATLETKLASFKQQLNNYKEITIENASPGDVLEDGSIVVKKENGLALLAAPGSVEVNCQWSKDFPDVFTKLKDNGFNPSQWFIPTKEQLNLAYQNPEVRKHFVSTNYWSSTEVSATYACDQLFLNGSVGASAKTNTLCVRPFRCVVF